MMWYCSTVGADREASVNRSRNASSDKEATRAYSTINRSIHTNNTAIVFKSIGRSLTNELDACLLVAKYLHL